MAADTAQGRIVCKFSCGAASAVATKLALQKHHQSREVVIHNAFVQEEHEDNRRFLADCERWFGQAIEVFRDARYGASARTVFSRKRYMKGLQGAPCSQALKRRVLDAQVKPGDVVILGYTADEEDRFNRWIDANNDRPAEAPLIEAGLGKGEVLALIERAGIELPLMYRLGYHNANCIGCVKGGAGYWNKVRRDFPTDFAEMAEIERSIGQGARLLRHRSGPLKGQRFYLTELHPDAGRYQDEPSIECGAACELVEAGWAELQEEAAS